MRLFRYACAVVFITALAASPGRAQKLESGDLAIEYVEGSGVRLTLRGVPVSRGSSVQIHAPGWKEGYYASNSARPGVEIDASGRRITLRHASEKIKLDLTETIQLVGDNRVELILAGRMDGDIAAQLEWAIGYLNAFAFYGGEYVDLTNSAKPVPVVREPAVGGEKPEVLRSRALALNSPAGLVAATLQKGDATLSLLDGRRAAARGWASEQPSFWLGVLNFDLKPGKAFELRVAIEITPPSARPPAGATQAAVESQPIRRAYEPTTRPAQIIPKPARFEARTGSFVFHPEEKVFANEVSRDAAKLLAGVLEARFGVKLPLTDSPDIESNSVRISVLRDPDLKPEGYLIRATEHGIQVYAADPAGFRFATYTLLQLAQVDASGRWFIPSCEVDDSPALAFRGVHIFPGKDSIDLHRRLIENVIAPLKFNHVILECEYTQWDSARGVWIDISVPKQQIAQYVKLIRDAGMEPIPLVASLGHSAWMFKNGQNRDLAEDQDTPTAYDATNPRSQEFMQHIFDEACELFAPVKYFHIGHDEVALFGRYPGREESKKWGITKLFLHDVAHWDKYLKSRGAKLMLWGDMLLHRSEIEDGAAMAESAQAARELREKLPKDAVICDWHYDALAPEKYKSLAIFSRAGFRTIAASWHNPANIFALAQAARMYGAWGLLQTTWAGYNIDEAAVERELKQFSAYVLAAEYSWSADSPPPEKLPYRVDDVFTRAMNPVPFPNGARKGFLLDLAAAANAKSPTAFKLHERSIGYAAKDSERVVMLAGALSDRALPREAKLTFQGHPDALVFIVATSYPVPPADTVGRIEVTFDNGSTSTMPLVYGRNIRAWDAPAATPAAMLVPVNTGTAAYAVVWKNSADRPITSIRFIAEHPYASPMLIAVTGIDEW